ncbi:MAG TPA: glycoside hydrolase family 3 N-terminal domain-containing protein [Methylomirabilota bacterium]|nr:glycoside hydrolase family 3 N-terminal domain-containing protein [Methylomirabilota bacterium]
MNDGRPERASDGPGVAMSRRAVLHGLAMAAVSLFLAGCRAASGTASPSATPLASATAVPSAPSSQPTPTPPSRSATPSPTPSPGLSLETRVAGLIVVGFRGSRLDQATWVRTALARTGLGGVILFDRDQESGGRRNVVSAAQLRTLVGELRAAAGDRQIIVSIDQEGGVVTRLSPAHGFRAVASEADIGDIDDAGKARSWGEDIAETLASVGIDLNFAPVVDLDVNPKSPAIGALDRSFSADPDVVVAMATAEIAAHRAAGIRTTLKHFPGIGSSTTNTDFGVADVTKTWTRRELEPFQRLIDAGTVDLIMAGHVVNGQLDPDHPASLSAATVNGLLRDEMGWSGPVVTDDLQAAAIDQAFGFDEAVVLALEAGNDLLLFANQQGYDPKIVSRAIGAVVAAVESGRLPAARIDEAWQRVKGFNAGRGG